MTDTDERVDPEAKLVVETQEMHRRGSYSNPPTCTVSQLTGQWN